MPRWVAGLVSVSVPSPVPSLVRVITPRTSRCSGNMPKALDCIGNPMGRQLSDETMPINPKPHRGVSRRLLMSILIGVVVLAGTQKAKACPAAEERKVVITVDEVHHGLTFPAGSKLIIARVS
jgi:hypothetical protein